MRILETICDCGHVDTLYGVAEQYEIKDFWSLKCDKTERCIVRMMVQPEKQQAAMDAIQAILDKTEDFRLVVIPVEAILPRPEAEDDDTKKQNSVVRSREELYQSIMAGVKLDSSYVTMVVLSTIVASIGLLANNVAVVIGAMVIAPLLGPNIALAFASTLGDSQLIWRALKANLIGLGIALLMSIIAGYVWPHNINTTEILARTDIGYDGIILALASGAAAVLSLTSGWSNTLVGVMVAVALLPPTATLGLMLGSGNWKLAIGAGLLLALNIVCVNLSAKLMFVIKGVKPRTWLEKNKARQSVKVSLIFWVIALSLLVIFMQAWHTRT